jgi:NADH-quinone oxidoreductase subunit L
MIHIPLAVYVLFLAPLAALAVGFFVIRPLKPEWTHIPILASCLAVTSASAYLAAFVYTGRGLDGTLFLWMTAGDWSIPFGVRIDGVGVSVLAMVSLVGALIHVYAVGYMKGDPGFARFFLLFHLFYLSMIGLLVSNNYAQFYLFWELVGGCSYFLIGYWMHKETARRASLQAFLTLRVADFGLMLAVLILLGLYRNTRFAALYAVAGAMPAGLLALLGFLFVWAAAGKSALFPLYFWLPDAMEGPTPVSALMHAATMVTAGIFLLVRSWPLISLVPGLPESIAVVGAATAIFAAILAATQTDLKRILAYSTVSHLGLMAFGLGLGQVAAGVAHLVTHGFFKGTLFLCAGVLAHAAGKSTVAVSEVGGLRRKLPLTFLCFLAAALSLAGFPFTAGYFSKDAILDAAFAHGGWAVAAGLAIAMGGAFYISRMLFLTFFGDRSEQQGLAHPHETSPVMGVPVAFLALGALAVGWLGQGLVRMLLSGWPQAVAAPALTHPSRLVSAAGLAAAALGAGAAWWLTMLRPSWDWDWRRRRPALAALFAEDLGWRRVPAACAGASVWLADKVGRVLDHDSWDAAIEGSAGACRRLSEAGSRLATGSISDSLWWVMTGAAALLAWAAWR